MDDLSKMRLSRIKTRWTSVVLAHQGGNPAAAAAQLRLMLAYYRPVYCYLRGMVRDDDIAEELTQEFCVRFLRGDFRGANPGRGRFRDLIKAVARHLALDWWKREQVRRKKGPHPLPAADQLQPAAKPPREFRITLQTEAVFASQWRQSLLSHAWKTLARVQKKTGCLYFTVLRYKSAHPKTRSHELAAHLTARLGRKVTAAGVRQLLGRARRKFAECLVLLVKRSLPGADAAEIERELIELNLLVYCKDALQRLQRQA